MVSSAPRRQLGRKRPRFLIYMVNIGERTKLADRKRGQRFLDDRGDVEKADAAFDKGMHRGLVRRIEHGRAAASRDQSLARQAQRRKALLIGWLERQPT